MREKEKEKEKEENPLLSSRSFRLPTSRTKMTPVATLNTRRLLRNHLLTAFPCRKEITDTAISCEGSETRAEKLFQRSSIRLPKRGYLHESLLNLPIYRFFPVFPASSSVLSVVHSALSFFLCLSIYLCPGWSRRTAASFALQRWPERRGCLCSALLMRRFNEENFMLRVKWHN